MEYKQITVIVNDQGTQISDAKTQVLNKMMGALSTVTSDTLKLRRGSSDTLAIAETMSYFFNSQSFEEMVMDEGLDQDAASMDGQTLDEACVDPDSFGDKVR